MLIKFQECIFVVNNNTIIAFCNIIGMVPVWNGHCTFYHYPGISNTYLINLYFQLAYKSLVEVGVLMSEVRLAEDSIQSIPYCMKLTGHVINANFENLC